MSWQENQFQFVPLEADHPPVEDVDVHLYSVGQLVVYLAKQAQGLLNLVMAVFPVLENLLKTMQKSKYKINTNEFLLLILHKAIFRIILQCCTTIKITLTYKIE